MNSADGLEHELIREFSSGDNQIGLTQERVERRERIRLAIYMANLDGPGCQYPGTTMTYAEAFRECYGERLDRRGAMRAPSDAERPVESEGGEA